MEVEREEVPALDDLPMEPKPPMRSPPMRGELIHAANQAAMGMASVRREAEQAAARELGQASRVQSEKSAF